MIANARLSARSAAGYKKIGGFMRDMLRRITLIAAQNQEDGDRFIELGLKRSQLAVTGSLKFDISVTPELAARAVTLRRQWAPRRQCGSLPAPMTVKKPSCWKRIANCWKTPRSAADPGAASPGTLPDRQRAGAEGRLQLHPAQQRRNPVRQHPVVIGDTMGELMLLYGIADLAFVGGSLVERGGHNRWKPPRTPSRC